MVDLKNLLQKNAVVIAGILLIVIFAVWFVSSFGIPLLGDSPDTFEPQTVTSIDETEDSVRVRLSDPSKADRTVVVANGREYEWDENNTVLINKSNLGSGSVRVQSYSGGNLYETYTYDVGSVPLQIVNDNNRFVSGETYTFRVVSTSSQSIDNVQWSVDGTEQNASSTELVTTFDVAKNYTISVSADVGSRTFSVSRQVSVENPENVNFSVSLDKTNVTTFEEINASANLTTNQTIGNVTWNWGPGGVETIPINETSLNWYTEAGTYEVTATATTQDLGREISASETVNVEAREVDPTVYEIAVQVFSEDTGRSVPQANVSVGDLVSNQTDGSGVAQFDVIQGQYNVTVTKDGFRSKTITTDANDNVLVEVILEPRENETQGENGDGLITNNTTDDGVAAFDFGRNVSVVDNITDEQRNATAPEGLELILNQTPGNGTAQNPHIIRNVEELQAISVAPSEYYELGNDIDAGNTRGWNPVGGVNGEEVGNASQMEYNVRYESISPSTLNLSVNGVAVPNDEYTALPNGTVFMNRTPNEILDNVSADDTVLANYTTDDVFRGFEPIEGEGQTSIRLDGRGNTIQGLYINRRQSEDVAMIRNVQSGIIENINFESARVRGGSNVAVISSSLTGTTVENVLVAGEVVGVDEIGMVSGRAEGSELTDVNVVGSVSGRDDVGMVSGIIGSANGDKTVLTRVSSRTPDGRQIIGQNSVGGIVGRSLNAELNNTYGTVNIAGNSNVGGIIGGSRAGTTLKRGYVAANVNSDSDTAGAIVGDAGGGSINTYYWDTEIAGVDNPIGAGASGVSVVGLTTDEMQGNGASSSMSNLDFENIWGVTDTYPVTSKAGSGQFTVNVVAINESNQEVISGAVIELGEETKSGGNVTFENVARGQYNVNIRADGFVDTSEERFISEDSTIESTLTPAEQFNVTLSAVNTEGDIISGAEIVLDGAQKVQESTPVEFTDVDEGTYTVQYSSDFHVDKEVDVELTNDSAGGDDTVSESVILRETRNIEIDILDANSTSSPLEPVPTPVTITVNGPDTEITKTNVSSEGIEFNNIPALTSDEFHSITASAGAYEDNSTQITSDGLSNETSLELKLNRSEEENVLLIEPLDNENGEIASPVNISAVQLVSGRQYTKTLSTTDPQEPVPFVFVNSSTSGGGSVTVEINSSAYENKEVSGISVDENTLESMSLRAKQNRGIRVVNADNGSLIGGARATLKSNEPDIEYDNDSLSSADDGLAPFADVINGEYQSTGNAKGYDRKSTTFDFNSGETVKEIELSPQPEIIINLSVDTVSGQDKFQLEEVDVSNFSLDRSDITSAGVGDNNPEFNIIKGYRYRFVGSAVEDNNIDIIDSEGVVVGEPDRGLSGNLSIGFTNADDGSTFAFTATSRVDRIKQVSNYKERQTTSSDGLNGTLTYMSSPP